MPIQKITAILVVRSSGGRGGRAFMPRSFPKSRVVKVVRSGTADPGPPGTVMTVEFRSKGSRLSPNGGPHFKFT